MVGYIFVDVEVKSELVKVYGSPELDDSDFQPREFVSAREYAEGAYPLTVTADPYGDACRYAEREAQRLAADWGDNT